MTFSVWLSLLAACVVISLTPGAGAINTMTNAITEGWRRSIWGILGQQVGLLTHIAIVAAGVGLLVSRSPVLFGVIRYAGAAYLVYLGVRLMLVKTDAPVEDDGGAGASAGADSAASGAAPVAAPVVAPVRVHESAWSMARRGFWVNLLNPKSIVFFLAFIPQFIRLDQPALPQYLVLAGTCVVIDVVIMWGGFAAAARSFRRLTGTPRGRRTLNTVFGVLFILVAVLLVVVH